MSLTLVDIGYTYGFGTSYAMRALAGVALDVSPGELVLVVGATGSGKSTLLRIAAGLLEPDEGCVLLEGEALTRATARGMVGLIFQDAESQLFADTVIDDVAFGPSNLGATTEEARGRAAEALSLVGLDPVRFGARSPFSLSGGEARRAAIAGVLAMRPSYIMADEPSAGLDAPGRRALKALFLRAREDAGIVVVSHSAEEFLGEADRVLVLEGGRSALYTSADHVVANPSVLGAAGLLAPDVLEVQRLVRDRGIGSGDYTLDPEVAAGRLAGAGRCTP